MQKQILQSHALANRRLDGKGSGGQRLEKNKKENVKEKGRNWKYDASEKES
jgi:hypothetical protein